MEGKLNNLNSLLHTVFYTLLVLSGTTVVFLLVLVVARLRKKDYTAPKIIATWAGVATSVGSFAIAALNITLPIGILPESDPANQAINTFYTAIQSQHCSKAWSLVHSARKKELIDKAFGEVQFCDSYGSTLTYQNMEIQRQVSKTDSIPARIYRVAYDVWDEFPRNDLYDLRLKDYGDVVKSHSYDENKLTGVIMRNLRLYYVISDDAEEKIRELIAATPFWFTASPEFIAEIKRLLSVKYKIDLASQKTPPPLRRVERHYGHSLTMMLDDGQWKIRDGLATPVLVAPYVPRDRVL
jgi:hypothetical protein